MSDDSIKIKLRLSPEQLEILIDDWRTNFQNMSFNEYLDNLLTECQIDRLRK